MGKRTRALFESKEEWAKVRDVYAACTDPSEYEFVCKCDLIENWDHWAAILKSPYCRPEINKWRTELEMKIRSLGLKQIVEIAQTEKGYQAAKWLAEKGWVQKRGRPSKAEREGMAKQDEALTAEVDELFEAATGRAH